MNERKQFIVHLPLPDEALNLHVKVMFFGALADCIGMNQIDMSLSKSMSIAELEHILKERFATWRQFNDPLQYAINRAIVPSHAVVNRGDEVAFFPSALGKHTS